jgi:hypothetical protein
MAALQDELQLFSWDRLRTSDWQGRRPIRLSGDPVEQKVTRKETIGEIFRTQW